MWTERSPSSEIEKSASETGLDWACYSMDGHCKHDDGHHSANYTALQTVRLRRESSYARAHMQ
eukprot:CAMPEP_0183537076 /NCGR_PEP_ID=MMETSP0371-20130417/28688_1 /TAXON_ID=268820 /ORGANISM="Peridinium aciculiferum, Strain PAER-2" /LENGTH=62 /DNA_ID=CAMNT_0025737755 /DNA_START=72 /DNA_END=257 /DNA_ORIENTATION=+